MFPLREIVRPKPFPLYLYDNFRFYSEAFPASMIHFDRPLATFEELGLHATYSEANVAVEHKGVQLIEQGIAPGGYVVIYKSAFFDSYLLAVAISYAGGVPVMVSPHLDAEALTVIAGRLAKPWLVYDAETQEKATHVPSVADERKLDALTVGAIESTVEHPPAPLDRADEIVYMTHTSGTTGIPKLIAHSPTSMGWRVMWQRRILSFVDRRGLAAFHVSPVHSRFNIGISSLMSYGFHFLNIADAREENVEQIMLRYRPMTLETHPNHFVRWTSILKRNSDAFSSVKYLHSTFDAINKGTMLKYLSASSHRSPVFLQVYGQSECGPMVLRPHTRSTLKWSGARWMGIGMPGLTSVRVVDSAGKRLPRGKQGFIEMFSRGRAVTYFHEEDRFDQNVHGRWWNSGDQGKVGLFGQLAFLDRHVDLIENVESTLAIEDKILDELTFLDEVVLVHGYRGEPQPVVSVVKGHQMNWEAWWDCVADMPHMEVPVIMPYEQLPRTATMKVQRNQLESKLLSAEAGLQ